MISPRFFTSRYWNLKQTASTWEARATKQWSANLIRYGKMCSSGYLCEYNVFSSPSFNKLWTSHHSVRTCWARKHFRFFLANYTILGYLLDPCCFRSNNTDTVIEMFRCFYVQSSVMLLIINMTIVDFWWTN